MLFSYRDRLFCPGPTPLLREVEQRLGNSCYHRQADFVTLFQNCRAKLARLVHTESLPVLLATSGSGAMEAALVSLTAAGERVLVLNGGKFGERLQKIAQTYGCEVSDFTFPWGHAPDLNQLETLLRGKAKNSKLVCLQACETSTAVHYPLAEIAALVRRHSPDSLLLVDAISSLVAHELCMDDWQIDCVIGASHKGFGLPPGLAYVFCRNVLSVVFPHDRVFTSIFRLNCVHNRQATHALLPPSILLRHLIMCLTVCLPLALNNYNSGMRLWHTLVVPRGQR